MHNTTYRIRTSALVLGLIAFVVSTAQAAIIRIDNRQGRPTDFPDLGTAISKAQAGDTIYVAGSTDNYGVGKEIIVNKPLKLVGPGYFLDDNFPRNRTESFPAWIVDLRIATEGAGTEVTGLSIQRLEVNADDCFIHRCFFDTVFIGRGRSVARTRVHQSYFSFDNDGNTSLQWNGRDLMFSNNLFIVDNEEEITDTRFGIENSVDSTATFSHNTILNAEIVQHRSGSQTTFEGNILYLANSSRFNLFLEDNVRISENNIVGHLDGQRYNAPILDEIFLRTGSSDVRWQLGLSAENPARGAGGFGEDLGAFGGQTPYVISGIPPIPHFEIFEAQSTVGPTGTLKVRLRAKGGE